MKLTYTRNLVRRTFFAFLGFIIILSVFALFVRDSVNDKLNKISQVSEDIESNRAEPEKALLLLHQADYNFQHSLVNNDKILKTGYQQKLTLAFDKIDTLLQKQVSDTANLTFQERSRIKHWYQQKVSLSDQLHILRRSFDSLQTTYVKADSIELSKVNEPKLQIGKTEMLAKPNTVHKSTAKRGLIERLKDAINNKDANSTRHQRDTKENNAKALKVIKQNQLAYNKALQQLKHQNAEQLHTQRQLVTTNSYIINELGNIISQIKDINYNMADEFKGMALKSYQDSTTLLNKLYLAALFLLVLFSALLIVFITQLHQSELQLRDEIESSVALAQQKMDLLHHMSHEVRTPLTAIMGFLYIFSKSELTVKQSEMIESIKLSSDMMLRTLNDTLDAAKMEHSELTIHTEPFNPDYILSSVVESMAFSAEKKKLYLKYNFTGNKNAIILGDSFRLKQIVVNLLSNAIKFTNEGGITINAQLIANDTRLQVEVTDTGAGISAEQQAGLFSKYYQTSSSKEQVGTGLGLFICKQLIKLQNGKIAVKSEEGKGTTFTLLIPYQKNEKNLPPKTEPVT
ncbi:MAG TPA: HAMP domain-containing sensor histidine kinase [Mucilaginibacter sp.]|nr:HAMP domain-containing sensor histidine kinase [Mucilaginibacter sp.]